MKLWKDRQNSIGTHLLKILYECEINLYDFAFRLAKIVESCFHLVTALQTVVCTVMFCLTGFRMLLVSTDDDSSKNICILFNNTLFC